MRPATPPGMPALVDARCGLLTKVVEQPRLANLPRAFARYAACVASIQDVSTGLADPFGHGSSLSGEEAAWWAAVGEAVERYCGNAVPPDLPVATRAELRAVGAATVEPSELALYSPAQYRAPGFPFAPLTDDLSVRWCAAVGVTSGRRVLVPASLVYLNAHRGCRGEPRLNLISYAGIAAGRTFDDATCSAVEEVIERDAVTIWWASGAPAAGIDVRAVPALSAVFADPGAANLRWSVLRIPASVRIPVVGVLVEDPDAAMLAFGSACRATQDAAAARAAAEALQLLTFARELQDTESRLWRAAGAGVLPAGSYVAHRPDRTYRDAFAPDLHDMTDLAMQLQYWLDPRVQDGGQVDRLRRPGPPVGAPGVFADGRSVEGYAAELRRCGLEVLVVDVTTPDVRAAGLHVSRVVVPGTYGNAPAAFPYLGGDRIYCEPVGPGRAGRRAEEELVRLPLPFA